MVDIDGAYVLRSARSPTCVFNDARQEGERLTVIKVMPCVTCPLLHYTSTQASVVVEATVVPGSRDSARVLHCMWDTLTQAELARRQNTYQPQLGWGNVS